MMKRKDWISRNFNSYQIFLYLCEQRNAPLFYFNAVNSSLKELPSHLSTEEEYNLILITKLDWNAQMSPWRENAIMKNAEPFKGEAASYLKCLTQEMIPQIETDFSLMPNYRALCGYSMGGLFAIYSIFQTNLFAAIASISGSLWYPGLKEYLINHTPSKAVKDAYLSLGNKEAKTRNPVMRTVEEMTKWTESYLRDKGIISHFDLNTGGHFTDPIGRCAKAVDWIISQHISR